MGECWIRVATLNRKWCWCFRGPDGLRLSPAVILTSTEEQRKPQRSTSFHPTWTTGKEEAGISAVAVGDWMLGNGRDWGMRSRDKQLPSVSHLGGHLWLA